MDWEGILRHKHFALANITFVLLLALGLLVWVFRYDLKADKEGGMVRMDRLTGEVITVSGGSINTAAAEGQQATPMRSWPTVQLPSIGSAASVSSKWRDGALRYIINVSPYSNQIKVGVASSPATASITLLLEDRDGFNVATKTIELQKFTRLYDGPSVVTGIESKGSIFMTHETFLSIQSVNLSWAGFAD